MRLSSVVPSLSIPFTTGVAIAVMLGLAPLFGWALGSEEWLIVAALGMVALTPIVIRWPVITTFGAYAFLATSFDSIAFLEGAATLTRPAGIMAGGVLLVAGLMERRLTRPPMAAVWFGLFMLWAAASAVWALDLNVHSFALRRALSLFILYFAAVCFKPTRKELYWVCVLTVLGGVAAAAAGYLFGLDEGAQGRGRIVVGDRESNPNALGRTLLFPIALAIAGFVASRGTVRKAAAAVCVGAIGVGLFISMSRGAVVAMVVAIAVLLYRTRARKEILGATLVLLALTAAMPDRFYDRMTSVFTGEDTTGAGRTGLWELGLEAALGGFGIFGAGLGNTTEVYSLYVVTNHHGFGVHNTYLSLWIELGIVGVALMLAVFASHLLAARKTRAAGHGGLVLAATEAACFGVLASAMFADYLWTKSLWLPWILLTWAIHAERKSATGPRGG